MGHEHDRSIPLDHSAVPVEQAPEKLGTAVLVEVFRRFVQQQNRCVGQHCPSQKEPSSLTSRDGTSAPDERRVDTLGKLRNPLPQPHRRQRITGFVDRGVTASDPQILQDRSIEEMRILGEEQCAVDMLRRRNQAGEAHQ